MERGYSFRGWATGRRADVALGLLQRLADGRTLIFYDLRNRGLSDGVSEPSMLARGIHHDVDDLEAVRRNFGINFYALNAKGEYAGVSMYPGASYAVCTEKGPETLPCEPFLQGKADE